MLVVQWRANRVDFCTLTQRFGRAARDISLQGIGLLLYEPSFDEDINDNDGRKGKRKRKTRQQGQEQNKRRKVSQDGADSGPNDTQHTGDESQKASTRLEEGSGPQDTSSQATLVEVPMASVSQASPEMQKDLSRDDIAQGRPARAEMDEDDVEEETAVDFGVRWEEYFAWADQQQSSTKSGIEPALRDFIYGVKNCRRPPGRVYYSRSKELGKPQKQLE